MLRPMITPLFILAVVGCTSDPKRNAAATYVNSVQPLMLENRHLSERRLQIAAQLYNDDVPEDGVLGRWNTDVVPLSTHLHQQAAAVDVPPEWKDVHANLVVTWKDRSHAYIAMSEALRLSDKAKWDEARKLHSAVLKREETWFESVKARLAPMDLEIDPYP